MGARKDKKITLYSTTHCGRCNVLKSVLDTKKIKYEVKDQMDIVMAKAKELGTTELPIMVIEYENQIHSYSGAKAIVKGRELNFG